MEYNVRIKVLLGAFLIGFLFSCQEDIVPEEPLVSIELEKKRNRFKGRKN